MKELTMQEVIEHCERTAKKIEDNVKYSREWLGMESKVLESNRYLEHKQTAEWLKELQRLQNIKKNGTLIECPVKVDDIVYYLNKEQSISLDKNTIYEAKVVRIVTTHLGTSIVIQIRNEYGCTEIPNLSDFGETLFLSEEEIIEKLGQSGGRYETIT